MKRWYILADHRVLHFHKSRIQFCAEGTGFRIKRTVNLAILIASMAKAYQGILPDEMILSKIPGVDDPQKTLELLRKQQAESVAQAQEQFAGFDAAKRRSVEDEAAAAESEA